MTYSAASFFSGIGGIDLAFSWSGFDIRFQCEIDDYCRAVLKKHAAIYWPNAKMRKDIEDVTRADVGYVDVMFGGFPCQDISVAGKQAGITEGTRSGLWFELLRIIGEVRPRVILLENVANISMVGGLTVTATLAQVGYDAIWLPLRASDVGASHRRERWFCVGYSECRRYHKPKSSSRLAYNRKRNAQNRQRIQVKCASQSTSETLSGLAHAKSQRQQKRRKPQSRQKRRFSQRSENIRRKRVANEPRLGRVSHGISGRMDRHRGQWPARPNEPQFDYEPPRITDRKDCRVNRVKALGNAVVPQQVLPIVQAIKSFLDKIG